MIYRLTVFFCLIAGAAYASLVNVGTSPNDGTGDTVRGAFQKINAFAASQSANSVNVQDSIYAGGAKCDNATNDSSAFSAAFAAAPAGAHVVFPAGKTCYVGSQVSVADSVFIEGNGATMRGANITPLSLNVPKFHQTSLSILMQVGNPNVALPSVTGIGVGDLLIFYSPRVRLAASPANYTFGSVGVVTAVNPSMNFVTLRTAPFENYTATSLYAYKGLAGTEVHNLNVDVTGNTHAGNPALPAVAIYGHDVTWDGGKVTGSVYSGYGIQVFGENVTVHKPIVSGFLNISGLSGGGRIGDGVYVAGQHISVTEGIFGECKHPVTAGDRTVLSDDLHFDYNHSEQNKANSSLTAAGGDSYYHGLDFHANVESGTMTGNTILAGGTEAFTVRNGRAILDKNTVTLQKTGSLVVSASEEPITSLLISGTRATGTGDVGDYLFFPNISASNVTIADNISSQMGILKGYGAGYNTLANFNAHDNTAAGASAQSAFQFNGLAIVSGNIHDNTISGFGTGVYAYNNLNLALEFEHNTLNLTSGLDLEQSNSTSVSFGPVRVKDNNVVFGAASGTVTGMTTNIYSSTPSIQPIEVSGNLLWNNNTSNSSARSMRINGVNNHRISSNTTNSLILDNTSTYTWPLKDNLIVGVSQSWNGASVVSPALGPGDVPISGTARTGGIMQTGKYTPPLTIGGNITTTPTAGEWQWSRQDDTVSVSGTASIAPYASGATTYVTFPIPISSTFVSGSNCSGSGASYDSQVGAVYTSSSATNCTFSFKSSGTSQVNFFLNFKYSIH